MQVIKINGCNQLGRLSSNTYIAYADAEANHCFIIDPGSQAVVAEVLRILEEKQLQATHILCTHGHYDHTMGAHDLAKQTGAKVCIHENEAKALQSNRVSLAYLHMRSIKPTVPDILLTEGMQLCNGECTLEVLHTPGHSPGSVCFLSTDSPVCFTGDTIFLESYGATHLPGGNAAQLAASLQRVLALPPQTQLYAGHEGNTDIAHERVHNPHVARP